MKVAPHVNNPLYSTLYFVWGQATPQILCAYFFEFTAGLYYKTDIITRKIINEVAI